MQERDITEFGHLQLREEDFKDAPAVEIEGVPILDTLPERFEQLIRLDRKTREIWESTSYPSLSDQAWHLMLRCGSCGLDMTEAIAVHVAHYARHGRREDGIRKAPYALRGWRETRKRYEACEAGSGDGQPPEREPELEEPTTKGKDGESMTRLSRGAEEFLGGEIRPVEWAIEDIWPLNNSGPIGGPEKTGKTWLAHEMVLSLATGTPFLGKYRVKRPYRVLYWEEEDSRARTKRRGRQLLAGRNRPMPSADNLRYLVGHSLKIDRDHGIKVIRTEIANFRPDFVVIGNLREIHTKDENRPEMAQVRDAFRSLSREFGCGFVLIHHFRKAQADQSKRGSQMLAGSGVWGAWTEAWIYVTPGGSEDIALLEIGSKDAPGVGRLVVQRRDVMDGDALAEDEKGCKVWPVILGEVEGKDRADQSREEVRQAGEMLYESTKAPITVKQIMSVTSSKERTVRERARELVKSGAWQEVKLPRNELGYVPRPADTLL